MPSEQRTPDHWISSTVADLTVPEKASLCLGSDFWHTTPIPRLGVPRVMMADGPHGLRAQMNEADHVGLSGSVPATCFPTACALGSSWNRALAADVGRAIAREARHWGVSVVLGPGINMKRSPLCGRNFEYFAEDPLLAGELATAMVIAMQEEGVGASLKHFAANNQEFDRLRVSADVDERTLREIYLPAFEQVVNQAKPWTVMCAYNKINGVYASEHHELITQILRREWGFDGLVVSDWGAVHDRVAALRAGVDLEMPPQHGFSDQAIVDAVASGDLDEQVLDHAASRVLQLVERSGRPASIDPAHRFDATNHHRLARAAATECAVLLKNHDRALPLEPAAGSTVAVIGAFASTPRFQGSGSSQVNATIVDNALDALKAQLSDRVTVQFAAGFALTDTEPDPELTSAAVDLAARADHVVMFLGLPGSAESEGFDREHLDLPANQLTLLQQIHDVHPTVIVVLANGGVVTTFPWEANAAAILETWLSGQAAGSAAVDLLLGVANPSGKLAESIPLRVQDNPSYLNFPGDPGHVRYGEGVFIGYRGYDRTHQEVSYPFGFGLSYTTFDFNSIDIRQSGSVAGGDLQVQVQMLMTNTGDRHGAQVVQVYVGDPVAQVSRPVRELKAFDKVFLAPGQTRQVTLRLDQRSFAFWSVRHHDWVVEAGDFTVAVGTSSRHLVHQSTLSVAAPSLAGPLGAGSTLHEWLADDDARAVLFAHDDGKLLRDDSFVAVIGSMPMDTLAVFGFGFDRAGLVEMVDQLPTPA